eukprot:COSAG03_NODE_3430_length_2021_cov_13.434443_2_plen_131_part_00
MATTRSRLHTAVRHGACASFAFFGIHLGVRPYRKVATNWLKVCIEIQIFLTFLRSDIVRCADCAVIDVSHYQTTVIIGFVGLVPGAFLVCTVLTVRQRLRTTEETDVLNTMLIDVARDTVLEPERLRGSE